jgi:hypothetical protein
MRGAAYMVHDVTIPEPIDWPQTGKVPHMQALWKDCGKARSS